MEASSQFIVTRSCERRHHGGRSHPGRHRLLDRQRSAHDLVGAPNGCETIVHANRRWLQCHSNDEGRCLLTVDQENAFNQIDRSCLREVQRVAPRHCHLWHSNDSFQFGPETTLSRREVQQGDRLRPLLFDPGLRGNISEGTRWDRLRFPQDHAGLGFKNGLDDRRRWTPPSASTRRRPASLCPPSGGPSGVYGSTRQLLRTAGRRRKLRLMTQLVRLQPPPSSSFAFSLCQIRCHARTMPSDSLLHCLPGEVLGRASSRYPSWLRAQLSVKKGGLGIRDPELHSPAAFQDSSTGVPSELDPSCNHRSHLR